MGILNIFTKITIGRCKQRYRRVLEFQLRFLYKIEIKRSRLIKMNELIYNSTLTQTSLDSEDIKQFFNNFFCKRISERKENTIMNKRLLYLEKNIEKGLDITLQRYILENGIHEKEIITEFEILYEKLPMVGENIDQIFLNFRKILGRDIRIIFNLISRFSPKLLYADFKDILITPQQFEHLGRIIFQYRTLEFLQLNFSQQNGITLKAVNMRGITNNIGLQQLKIFSVIIAEFEAELIAEGLSKLQNLVNLDLYLFGSGRLNQERIEDIGKGLVNLKNLEILRIDLNNKLIDQRLYQISDSITHLQNLRSLDMQMMTNNQIQSIFQNLNDHKDIQSLSFSFQRSYDLNFSKFGKFLSQFPNLIYLSLRFICCWNIDFGDFFNECSSIINLLLSVSHNEKIDIQQLTKGISSLKNLQNLRLYFYENDIQQLDAELIGDMLAKFEHMISLKLFLSKNFIQTQGIEFISSGLSNLKKITKLYLDFSSNSINSIDTFTISLKKFENLKYFKLKIAKNKIDDSQVNDLFDVLLNIPLKALKLYLIDQQSINLLIREFATNNETTLFQNLKKFYLAYTSELGHDIVNLVCFLQKSVCLEILKLQFKVIGEVDNSGVQILSDGFQEFQKLKIFKLEVVSNHIDSTAAQHLSKGFEDLGKIGNLVRLTLTLPVNHLEQFEVLLFRGISHIRSLGYLQFLFDFARITIPQFKEVCLNLSQLSLLQILKIEPQHDDYKTKFYENQMRRSLSCYLTNSIIKVLDRRLKDYENYQLRQYFKYQLKLVRKSNTIIQYLGFDMQHSKVLKCQKQFGV